MIIKQIPNAITSANLFTGCIGIVFAFNQDLRSAALCILISLFIDFFDGFAARLLKVSGPMGKELDSLADMVSFGVLPSVILFHMAPKSFFGYEAFPILSYLAFFVAVFSAYRLAKFNLDTRQTDKFIGVPTPAISAVIASVPFIYESDVFYFDSSTTTVLLYLAFIPLACYLLVSEITLIALKFKSFGFSENTFRYTLIIASILLLVIFKFVAIPLILVLYIVLSIIENRTTKVKAVS
ncbi:CDP-diacylglycerol--serine O-phosphatidyltransferase [Pedobacter gandavensis]|uniref:CDP-diacylglycerol--serine O-phosphatidyltransferase n=1 Tax=Pedobacter gandavensis TaxID=2679963 RepID=A0ABR6EVC6_9SPHI|nr:CDP-diacylglycerol--serine O-phosphatidyltransferase [Pedobacter gandavensis]MBB2149199.1 CDP-diacylglycerol--serine O-phosphatidyltransferase [Pedobacter gandavensis]